MSTTKIATVIIAAGFSSRMHAFKPLLDLGGVPAIERLVCAHQGAGIEQIVIVTGHGGEQIEAWAKGRNGIRCVANPDYADGMYTSVRIGISALEGDVEAFFMHPADIPLVKVQTLVALMRAYSERRRGIIYPLLDGRRGHPPLIDVTYRREILSSDGEGGLKQVLKQFEDQAHSVVCFDEGILMDMDTQGDYERLCVYNASDAPSMRVCKAIMRHYKVSEKIDSHCAAVADAAIQIAGAINRAMPKMELNLEMLYAAARLHDIAKGEPDHAKRGARMLKELGYDAVGDLIAHHSDLTVSQNAPITEAEILFYVDKVIRERTYCSIERRFEPAFSRYADQPEVLACVEKRYRTSKWIEKKIEEIIGEGVYDGSNHLSHSAREN